MPSHLETAVYNTVRYFGMFDMPVTAVQIWRALVVKVAGLPIGRQTRWEGRHVPELREIKKALADSAWLKKRIGARHGYVFLQGKEDSVRRRLNRHVLAQHKWKITERVVRWLRYVPFVKMLAGSGSLALYNTKRGSDLDLFVVAEKSRIWTTRLLLLAAAQLTGRRRKYWNESAPNKVCLNHYLADDALPIPNPVRNLYAAMLYTHLTPLLGAHVFQNFQRENAPWMRGYLMYPEAPPLLARHGRRISPALLGLKRLAEAVLREPVGDGLERLAEKWQRAVIDRHARLRPVYGGQSGRVALSSTELAFHPDSKVPEILRRFEQDEGQKTLL